MKNVIASGLCEVIENIPPIIYEGELIVGYNYGHNESYDWGFLDNLKNGWGNIKEWMRAGGFTDEQLEEYYEKKLKIESLFEVPAWLRSLSAKKPACWKGYDGHGRVGYQQSFCNRL